MAEDLQSGESAEDLRLLRDSARTLLERAGGLGRARARRGGGWDEKVMREIADAGVLGVMAPDAAGGLGMGLGAAGVIAAEFGRALAPEPVVPVAALAIGMLHRLCPGDAGLVAAIGGEVVPALAWQERGPGGPAEEIGCRCDGNTLTGSKAWVVGASGAGEFLVVAASDSGPVLIRVARDAAGIGATPLRQSDGSDLFEIVFDATPGVCLAQGPQVAEALGAAVADATALAAAELTGVAERTYEITLEYLKTREQFGQPIGSFQAIQHRAADLNLHLEIARAAISEALALMQTAPDGVSRARHASRAKARACAAAQRITREAVQLHGAVGYTDELDVGLFLNRALVLSAWLGDAAHHRRLWLVAREAQGDAV